MLQRLANWYFARYIKPLIDAYLVEHLTAQIDRNAEALLSQARAPRQYIGGR